MYVCACVGPCMCVLVYVYIYTCILCSSANNSDQEHWYTYSSYYCHMPLNKYACKTVQNVPLHFYCGLYTDLTLLYIQVKKQQNATLIYYATVIYVPTTNMSLKCYKYGTRPNYSKCIYGGYISIYKPHMKLISLIM